MGSDIGSIENEYNTQSDEEVTVNPCPPDWLDDEENAVLRVDAIGDTAYTNRWVLRCLNTVAESFSKYVIPRNGNNTGQNNSRENHIPAEDGNSDLSIVELDPDVEDAVCQLWDMTTSGDVIIHLLNIEAINILELATWIIEDSRSPRLTEVMLGIVANIACHEFGIKKILDDKTNYNILQHVLNLISKTSDVQSLCEAFRFMCTLVHYRVFNPDDPSERFLSYWETFCQERIREIIAYFLKNTLSDVLLNKILDFLSIFLTFSEASLNIAETYGEQELVHNLIDVLTLKYEKFAENLSEEELEPIRHCVASLYAFLDKKGCIYLTDDVEKRQSLEVNLIQIVEFEAKIESVTDLRFKQTKNIYSSIIILKIFVPLINKLSIIPIIGRLLSIIYGQTHQYTVTRSTSKEELNLGDNENSAFKEFSEFFELKLAEKLESGKTDDHPSIRKEFSLFWSEKAENSCDKTDPYNSVNDSPAVYSNGLNCGWLSPSPTKDGTETRKAANLTLKSVAKCELDQKKDRGTGWEEINDLKEALEDYCCYLFCWWWNSSNDNKNAEFKDKQESILVALDQCHVHEVIFMLDSVRRKSPLLVAKLQEKLLDSGKHVRLVAILSHMYY